jgi:sulfide:quinone oxidoreductase
MKKIFVLGGGIGGVEAAIALTKQFKKELNKNYEIVLVSERDFLYIYPITIWIPVGKRTFEDVTMSIPQIAKIHGFKFLQEKVEKILAKENKIITDKQEHFYDYVIVALGGTKLRPKGIENTLSICGSPEEALKIKDRLFELIEKGKGTIAAGFGGNPKDPTAVRGGPVFEVLFNIDTLLRDKKIRDNFNLIFFSPSKEAGKRLGESGMKRLQKLFMERNIQPILGKKIKEFLSDGILFEDDSKVETDLTLFTPGLQGNPVLKESDLPLTEAGFVPIDDYCRAKGFKNCYVIGDSAYFEGPDWRAKQGHIAEVMGRVSAKNIKLQEEGKQPEETYKGHLSILCVMDLGRQGVFIYRNDKKAIAPMGAWAHWAKLAWEKYYKLNKLGKAPTIDVEL